jgi:hypothetical protein
LKELGRVGRLKRFLAPQLAELIVSQGNEKILESHRREIVVVFCDLRGYTPKRPSPRRCWISYASILKGLMKPVAAFNVLVPGSGANTSPPSK